jgi:glycosyltransferase involved in cell wall biosynthesis
LAEAHYQLGIALQEQGQEKQDVSLWKNEIIACYQRAIELNPNWGEAYLHLGKIEQQQDNLSTAASAYRQGLTILNPYYARAVATGETIPEEDTTSSQLPQQEIVLGRQSFPAIPPVSGDPARRPFWSVVIPVYNRTQYLLECLATVLAQWPGEGEMEILVIDDASTPPLAELVDSIGRGIVRYHRNPQNLGLPGSWNAGIALSRGQWIHLLHDDDYVLPGFYGQLKLSLENCPDSVGAAFTGYENIDETGNVIFRQQLYGEQAGIAENFLQRIGIANPLNMSAVVIRRATHEQLGGYHPDLVYTPDWELYKRIAAVYDWWYEPAILARYRQHSQNMTAQLFASGSQMKCIRRAIEISEAYLPPDCRSEITAKSRRHFFGRCLKNATHLLKSGKISEAFHLLLEAITLDRSNQALEELFVWLNQDDTVDLREQIITTLLQPVP